MAKRDLEHHLEFFVSTLRRALLEREGSKITTQEFTCNEVYHEYDGPAPAVTGWLMRRLQDDVSVKLGRTVYYTDENKIRIGKRLSSKQAAGLERKVAFEREKRRARRRPALTVVRDETPHTEESNAAPVPARTWPEPVARGAIFINEYENGRIMISTTADYDNENGKLRQLDRFSFRPNDFVVDDRFVAPEIPIDGGEMLRKLLRFVHESAVQRRKKSKEA